jgi:hypothetical protein
MPTVRTQIVKAPAGPKLQYANYHITLNTNRPNDAENYTKTEQWVNNLGALDWVKYPALDLIEDVGIQAALELDKKGRLHAHVYIRVKHRSTGLGIDYTRLHTELRERYGESPRPYINVKKFNNHGEMLENYIKKDPITGPTV